MSTDKSKIKIAEEEFQTKLVCCTGVAQKSAVLSSLATAFLLPIILWRLKFLRTNIETRFFTSILSAVPVGYYMALRSRTKCLEQVENDYTY